MQIYDFIQKVLILVYIINYEVRTSKNFQIVNFINVMLLG